MRPNVFTLVLFVIFVGLFSCKTQSVMGPDDEKKYIKAEKNAPGQFYNLSDHLVRVPGIQKVNGVFQIRGNQSFNGSNEPLYVIDGVRVGQNYQRANSVVDVNDIEDIKVIKSVQASSKYGMMGSSGVIEIRTKSGQ